MKLFKTFAKVHVTYSLSTEVPFQWIGSIYGNRKSRNSIYCCIISIHEIFVFLLNCKVTNFEVPSTTTNVKLPLKSDVISLNSTKILF